MANTNLPSNSNGKNDHDYEEEDNIVTMVDVLKAEETLEENADAVLGPGDDKNCTFDEGYLKRQALYSCLTCMRAKDIKHAGICLACSYHCHGDHELVELYTKRNFKCDCGNDLFKGVACTLTPKSGTNEKNRYNQNFQGTYCSCHRPYPDPDNSVEDEMIQCIVCEDWFHSMHLGSDIPKEDEYSEMICSSCSDNLPFLQFYRGHSVSKICNKNNSVGDLSIDDDAAQITQCVPQTEVENTSATEKTENKNENGDSKGTEVKVEKVQKNIKDEEAKEACNSVVAKENVPETEVVEDAKQISENDPSEICNNIVNILTPPTENDKKEEKECKLKSLEKILGEGGATFWTDELRKILCRCTGCMDVYKSCNVMFLIDEKDTVQYYEETGKGRKQNDGTTQYERGMEALSSLDRVQQMEAILSYNEMKTSLSEYLAKFVENKKVVREEDIKEFFSDMKARKRQRLDIPYSCR